MVDETTQPSNDAVEQSQTPQESPTTPPTENTGENKILDLFETVKDDAKLGDFQFLQKGDNIIDFSNIESLEIVGEDFQQDGVTKKVKKLIVNIKGQEKPWKMPITTYEKIKILIKEKYFKLKIVKAGEKLDTTYNVIPVR